MHLLAVKLPVVVQHLLLAVQPRRLSSYIITSLYNVRTAVVQPLLLTVLPLLLALQFLLIAFMQPLIDSCMLAILNPASSIRYKASPTALSRRGCSMYTVKKVHCTLCSVYTPLLLNAYPLLVMLPQTNQGTCSLDVTVTIFLLPQ
jgi:hypothetical protein